MKYSDLQYTSLTLDKKMNSLIYRTLFYVNIYGSYKFLKTVRFFDYPVVIKLELIYILLVTLTKRNEEIIFCQFLVTIL